MQLLIITQSGSFQKLIKELDSAFVISDIKLIKQIIYKVYDYTLPYIKEILNKNAISVSLTTDM